MITPDDLKALVDVLREAGAQAAELTAEGITLRVSFKLETLPRPDDDLPAGWPEWKGEK